MRDVFARLYQLKLILSCLLLVVGGSVLLVVDNELPAETSWRWLVYVPWGELGGILIGAGLLSIWLDHLLRREQAAIDDLRLRALLKEHAPTMRDAVLDAFAANHEDLARVATPETLDQIISNSLALRLHDPQFAREIYTDIRDQAISASERWHDVSLSVELSPLPMGSGAPSRSTAPSNDESHFAVTVRWEYTTVPRHTQRRFVCVGDREEYAELAHEREATSAWYLRPSSGDAGAREAFELLRFAVNGDERAIRRSVRKAGQTYTASIGADHVAAGQPVTISYTYRTVTAQNGHLLFFEIEQPTRDLKIDFTYTDCGVATVRTLDMVPSMRPIRIERPPAAVSGKVVRVDIDGWIFPRSGVAFVWTLEREVPATQRRSAA